MCCILRVALRHTYDSIEVLDLASGISEVLVSDRITAQVDLSLSPDGRYLAYTWPFDGGHELRLMAVSSPDTSVLLTRSRGMPLAPAFSHDGQLFSMNLSRRHFLRSTLKTLHI